ncbi:hypothetical protein SAMN05216327_109154 [Dyadobacter sp. SG02]|uniref:hypothetical protein n=1 Tax=Dyadobacter sp. SG02 TaxID=1855291 RepID=UPI0008D13D2B|nr:hypothetical protein [Dyadobacter sp. SG02]SEJ38306.1 hypothetical protein SAMN05216327_109154 [Dyadobacter sp. SG02]
MQLLHRQSTVPPSKLPPGQAPGAGKKLMRLINRSTFAILSISLMAVGPYRGNAQNVGESSYLGNSKYIEISPGTGLGRLRDFATSPLFYEGTTSRMSGALSRLGPSRDISTGVSVLRGTLTSDYNEHEAQSKVTTISIHHARLYQIFRNSAEKWNFKAGTEANLTGNLRVNPALMNSAVGIEAFPIIFGTFKVTRDITRATGRRGKEPKKKSLSFKVNASLLSASFRNGYSYLGIGQVIDKSGLEGLLDDYRFKAFGVNALSTSLDYTLWLKNKNGWRFSYGWDAYKTRKDYADFEMASHTLRVALLFNTKNN